MHAYWLRAREKGREPTARQIAAAVGVSIHVARKALPRFREGWVPTGRGAGLEAKTVHNVHVMLHKALNDAVAWHYLTENVARQVHAPKLTRRRPTVWTPAQLRRFLQAARSDRFHAGYVLAATTGLRRAELCGLRWSAVDLGAGTVTVEPDIRVVVNGRARDSDAKTAYAVRMLSIDHATVAALTEWRAEQRSEMMFFDR
jgi:integrase